MVISLTLQLSVVLHWLQFIWVILGLINSRAARITNIMNIQKALAEFITFGEHRDEAISVIVSSSAHNAKPLYKLTTPVLIDVLKRCVSNEIDLDDLALWANVIESRADIDSAEHEGVIYALSNSEQMGEFSHKKLEQLLALLKD
ncbi:MAG: hypothetical protein ACI9H9_002613 [Pseudoalteromonas tetraodonis]